MTRFKSRRVKAEPDSEALLGIGGEGDSSPTPTWQAAEGIAKPVAKGIGAAPLVVATLTGIAAVAVGAIILGLGAALCGVAGLAIGHAATRLLFDRKLGGYTGDCLGAVQQISEVGFYLAVLAWV